MSIDRAAIKPAGLGVFGKSLKGRKWPIGVSGKAQCAMRNAQQYQQVAHQYQQVAQQYQQVAQQYQQLGKR